MQKAEYNYKFAAAVILALIVCLFNFRPANAVTFNFSAICTFCNLPLALPESPVSGELILNDSLLVGGAVTPDTGFSFEAIDSFSLTFQTSGFPLPTTDPAIFKTIELGIGGFIDPFGGPVTGTAGGFNSAGDGIQTLILADTFNQFFQVDFGLDAQPGSAFWEVEDQSFNFGEGEPIAFDLPKPTIASEPGSLAILLFSMGSLIFIARRPRRIVGRRAVANRFASK